MKLAPNITIKHSLEDIDLQDLDNLSSQTTIHFLQTPPKKKEEEQPVITFYNKNRDSSNNSLF